MKRANANSDKTKALVSGILSPDERIEKSKKLPKAMALLTTASPVAYFIRHGETDMNKANDFRGDLDVPLNHEGQKQAQQLVPFFHNVTFGQVYNSSRFRTKETLAPLLKAKGLQSETSRLLDSLDTGDFSGQPKDKENMKKMMWYNEHQDAQIPGGEKVRSFRTRVDAELLRVIEEGQSGHPSAACIHGSVVKELSRMLHDDMHKAHVEPGGVVGVYKIPAGGYRAQVLLAENDTEEHLPYGS